MSLKRILLRGVASAVATTATASACSKLQTGRAASALNATSHIVWGERAFGVDSADARHTFVGALLNVGAMLAWSTVYELLPEPRSALARAAKATGVTVAAYVTDYYLVPKRLTPGFEARLSFAALATIYVALGAGFLSAPDGV